MMPDQDVKTLRIKPVTQMTPEIEELLSVDPAVLKRYGGRAPTEQKNAGPQFLRPAGAQPGLAPAIQADDVFLGLARPICLIAIAKLRSCGSPGSSSCLSYGASMSAWARRRVWTTDEIALIAQGLVGPADSTSTKPQSSRPSRNSRSTRPSPTRPGPYWGRVGARGSSLKCPVMVGTYQILGWMQAITEQPLWEGNAGLTAR